jgi:hypothetical protein
VVDFNRNYSLERIKICNTKELINDYHLDESKLSEDFKMREKTITLQFNSKKFRTDPYAGFLCGFKNLLCFDNDGRLKNNIVMIPTGIKYSDVERSSFSDLYEDLKYCPIVNKDNLEKNDASEIVKHLEKGCIYTLSKHQRIFGTVADLIIFDDRIYYNKNYGY